MSQSSNRGSAKSAAELVAEARSQVNTCTPNQAAERLRAGPSPLIIDLREPAEYGGGSITGAINVPRGVLEFQIARLCPDRDQPIVVHCAGGGRAVLAAKTLVDMGYGFVTAVEGKFSDLVACINASPGG